METLDRFSALGNPQAPLPATASKWREAVHALGLRPDKAEGGALDPATQQLPQSYQSTTQPARSAEKFGR
ncbi:MAG: hypothetical protein R6W93_15395, partial [Candidatus Limnocylindrales bacterium]